MNRFLGLILWIFSIVFVAAVFQFALYLENDLKWPIIGSFSILFLGLAYKLHKWLKYKSKKYVARAKSDEASDYKGSTVLYLRPFSEDFDHWEHSSYEELLAKAIKPFGRMIALGKPEEKVPTFGASRIYANDSEWQNNILKLLSTSNLVIMNASYNNPSSSLVWEMQQVHNHVDPERFLLFGGPESFSSISSEFSQVFNVDLIEKLQEKLVSDDSLGFFEFQESWQCRFIPLKNPPVLWRDKDNEPSLGAFRFALKPVFQKLGVTWTPSPPILWKLIVTIFFTLVIMGNLWKFLF